MRRVLTFEEDKAKTLAEMAELAKHTKPPKEKKCASVIAYSKFIDIASYAVYRSACRDPKGYQEYLTPDIAAPDLGREARKALMASRFITPKHPEWDAIMRFPTKEETKASEEANKARAGVKTRKALFNGAGCVTLRLRDAQIEISPLRYLGRGGWEGIRGQDDIFLPEDVSNGDFGVKLQT